MSDKSEIVERCIAIKRQERQAPITLFVFLSQRVERCALILKADLLEGVSLLCILRGRFI